MLALVPGVVKQAEEDEASRDRGVQDTQEDDRRDHEGEGNVLVRILERTECWSRHVLVTGVGIDDGPNDAEQDDLRDGAGP